MTAPRLGVAIPFFHAFPGPEYVALAREIEARGYDSAWTGEVSGADAVTVMSVIAGATTRLRVGSAVVPIQTRTPIVLGLTGATLGHLAPGRVILGLGVSSRIIVEQWHGLPFKRPLAQLREVVNIVRLVMAGERVNFEGEFYRLQNFRMTAPPPSAPVAIYLAALGVESLELAGEIADGVILNWIAPESVPESVRHLETGARRAGRSLADFEIAAFIRTCVTDDPAAARDWLARDITGYATVDVYASAFRAAGWEAEIDAVNAAWKAGDRAGAVKQVSPRFLDGLGVVGSADFCRARMAAFTRAGLTLPVVFPFAPDPTRHDPRPTLLRTIRAFP